VLYLKVDDSNRADFEAAGMEAFAPDANKPEYRMSYYEVPVDVLEERDLLALWARKAIAVADAAAAKKPGAAKKKLAAPVKKTAVRKTAARKE
jgi:DNA transformation protein